jgi:hypothetical protein
MRIKTFGAKHPISSLLAIEEGFKTLGHEIVEDNPDIIYCNNFPYDEALNEKGYKIFTLLDIPFHCWKEEDFVKCQTQLARANKICSISKTVQNDIAEQFAFDSTVIYQPTMNIFPILDFKSEYDYKYLIVGRAADPNKRNNLAISYLKEFDPDARLAIIGNEPISYGDWFGVLPTRLLNEFYNSAQYVFCLTKYGGIELSGIEAVLAGKFPIVCSDSKVGIEFNCEFAAEPTTQGIHNKILGIEANLDKYQEIVKNKRLDFITRFDRIEVARKILTLGY